MADAMNLHGVPPPAARRRDAATIKSLGSNACREVCGLANGSSHGFGARGRRALLGFSNALIVAKLLAVGLGGRERGLGAGRDRIALVLGDSGKDMDRELGGRLVVAANEVDLAIHQHRNERQVIGIN
jgi:hypothetical protein